MKNFFKWSCKPAQMGFCNAFAEFNRKRIFSTSLIKATTHQEVKKSRNSVKKKNLSPKLTNFVSGRGQIWISQASKKGKIFVRKNFEKKLAI